MTPEIIEVSGLGPSLQPTSWPFSVLSSLEEEKMALKMVG